MGGRGSGRRATQGLTVTLCDETRSIDLARLDRKRLLVPGRWSTLTWSINGEKTGSIQLTRVHGGIKLSYRARDFGEDWRQIEEVIPLVETATSFAGRREWFGCLSCGRSCRIIYGGILFRCRRCQGLRYESQYEPPFARAASRALKIRAKLGGAGGIDDPFPEKPRGMHRRTYERLRQRAQQFEGLWAVGLASQWQLIGMDD